MNTSCGLTPLTLTDLDSIRAEVMMALLTKEGREEIWKYDIVPRRGAVSMAVDDMNFDSMEAARSNRSKPYALIGPGIEDMYFGTVAELVSLLFWVCQKALGGDLCVSPENTYQNQLEFLDEATEHEFPFIPFKS